MLVLTGYDSDADVMGAHETKLLETMGYAPEESAGRANNDSNAPDPSGTSSSNVIGSNQADMTKDTRCLEKGAVGYVVKDSPSAELFMAIRRVASGLPHVSPDVASRLVRLRQAGPSLALNDREAEILRLVAEGMKTQEIARSVRLAERTVKHYLELIRQKLGAKNSSHAVALAVQRGLIRIKDG